MVTINTKSATYACTTSTFSSDRGLSVAFTRSGDADACLAIGDYETSTLEWAYGYAQVYVRNDSAWPIDYHCWYEYEEGDEGAEETVRVEFTGTVAAGETKLLTDTKTLYAKMLGVFTVPRVAIYGVTLS